MAKEVYASVRERDQHRCQFPIETDARGDTWKKCGESFRTEAHHRRIRSQGGDDSDENLILLCQQHHTWVHAHPTEARDMGLLLSYGDDPSRHHWMESAIPEDGYMDEDGDCFNEEAPGVVW